MEPRVAVTAPGSPTIRSPTKVAELIATGPGVMEEIVDKIGKFPHTEPAVTAYNFTLDERNSCIATLLH